MNLSSFRIFGLALIALSIPACNAHREEHVHEVHKITATTPQLRPVTLTQQFVCQIHSQRHIKVRALETGYLEAIPVKEGQAVKNDDLLFSVRPILYQSKFEAESAKARLAQLKLNYTKKLAQDKVVSPNEVALQEAELSEANAKAQLAKAEWDFATVKAPFDGIVDRLYHQQGSLVQEGEILTTLSDNSLMWVYFNVPEKVYLEYMSNLNDHENDVVELQLANHQKFEGVGKIGAIEADFNNETGNIKFRADFHNPHRLLRHGQTGTILISRVQDDAIVIPQRATFEVLQKRYVFVVDKDNVAHQREIVPQTELEDLYVIKSGLGVDDKIVLEGIRQVRDGSTVEYEDRKVDEVVANLKYHAE